MRRTWILGTAVVALVAAGCGDDSHDSDPDGGDENGAGKGSGANNGSNDGGPNGSGGNGGVVVGDGSELSGCMTNMDCDPGLNCYTFGGYCSKQCEEDTDCTSLGANGGCYVPPGGGMGIPGIPGGSGAGGATSTSSAGTCRISCSGTDDTSCPSGFMCIDVGGVGGMNGTFRCALPGADNGNSGGSGGMGGFFGGAGGTTGFPGGMQMPGDTEAFGECQGGGCIEGLICSGRGGTGFCTQECDGDDECTNQPSSGDVAPTCGASGRCILACIESGEDACPDGMTCNPIGGGIGNDEDGGQPTEGRCNY